MRAVKALLMNVKTAISLTKELVNTVKWEAPPGGLHTNKNDDNINFSFIEFARWRLPVNSVNSKKFLFSGLRR